MKAQNAILDELYATRAELLAEAGDDLHRYVDEARVRALASGHPIAEPVKRTPRDERPPEPPEATPVEQAR
jgi:hypothetical protein